MSEVDTICWATMQRHSRTFALASRLFPRASRREVAILYTWCRRCDDAIDLAAPEDRPAALARLRAELAAVYAGEAIGDPVLVAFGEVVRARRIPRHYPEELLEGMAMDVAGRAYASLPELMLYCYRVAGTVGLMMCHVLGLRDASALRHAAHLGMAMQLTNICRDVQEDWGLGRLYIPDALLADTGAPELRACLGAPLPARARAPLAGAVRALLADAARLYRSGRRGLGALPWGASLAIDAAARMYAAIGREIARRDHDVTAGRAVVPRRVKIALLLAALFSTLIRLAGGIGRPFRRAALDGVVEFSRDLLPAAPAGAGLLAAGDDTQGRAPGAMPATPTGGIPS